MDDGRTASKKTGKHNASATYCYHIHKNCCSGILNLSKAVTYSLMKISTVANTTSRILLAARCIFQLKILRIDPVQLTVLIEVECTTGVRHIHTRCLLNTLATVNTQDTVIVNTPGQPSLVCHLRRYDRNKQLI